MMAKTFAPKVLTKRADFLAANKGLRNARAGFVLLTRANSELKGGPENNQANNQANDQSDEQVGGKGVRYGITVTKKIGNAVVRNRMKRRFRELLRAALADHALPDHDHILIGRAGGVERDFGKMAEELSQALSRARAGKGDPPRGRRPMRGSKKAPQKGGQKPPQKDGA